MLRVSLYQQLSFFHEDSTCALCWLALTAVILYKALICPPIWLTQKPITFDPGSQLVDTNTYHILPYWLDLWSESLWTPASVLFFPIDLISAPRWSTPIFANLSYRLDFCSELVETNTFHLLSCRLGLCSELVEIPQCLLDLCYEFVYTKICHIPSYWHHLELTF